MLIQTKRPPHYARGQDTQWVATQHLTKFWLHEGGVVRGHPIDADEAPDALEMADQNCQHERGSPFEAPCATCSRNCRGMYGPCLRDETEGEILAA